MPEEETLGLIGITEIVGNNSHLGVQNLAATLTAVPSVALGIMVGVMMVRGVRTARGRHFATG